MPSHRVELDALGHLRGGYVASGTQRESMTTPVQGLQPSNVVADGTVDWGSLSSVDAPREPDRYLIREGDVLLPLRSARLSAFVADGVQDGTIAVGHWMIFSPDRSRLLPAFLVWYLNHPATSQRLRSLSKGSNLQFLPLSSLRSFEIEVPSLQRQSRIVRVVELNDRLARLENDLSSARQRLVNALALRLLSGSTNTSLSDR